MRIETSLPIDTAQSIDRARNLAREGAVKLAAFSAAAWRVETTAAATPLLYETFRDELIRFAIDARRYLEIANVRGVRLAEPPTRLHPYFQHELDGVETLAWDILNTIVHARKIKPRLSSLGKTPADVSAFIAVEVESDRRTLTFCPSALADAVLKLDSPAFDLDPDTGLSNPTVTQANFSD